MTDYKAIAADIVNYNLIAGVRTLREDEQYEVDDECRQSYEWDLENDCSAYFTTGELAGGTCATTIDISSGDIDTIAAEIERIVEVNKAYADDRQVVIAGKSVNNDGYFDTGEIRIVNAFVLGVIE